MLAGLKLPLRRREARADLEDENGKVLVSWAIGITWKVKGRNSYHVFIQCNGPAVSHAKQVV